MAAGFASLPGSFLDMVGLGGFPCIFLLAFGFLGGSGVSGTVCVWSVAHGLVTLFLQGGVSYAVMASSLSSWLLGGGGWC